MRRDIYERVNHVVMDTDMDSKCDEDKRLAKRMRLDFIRNGVSLPEVNHVARNFNPVVLIFFTENALKIGQTSTTKHTQAKHKQWLCSFCPKYQRRSKHNYLYKRGIRRRTGLCLSSLAAERTC